MRWGQKPVLPAINRRDPLARGLLFACPMWPHGGRAARDLVSHNVSLGFGHASMGYQAGSAGWGWANPQTTDSLRCVQFGSLASRAGGLPYTVMAVVRSTSGTSNYLTIAERAYVGGNQAKEFTLRCGGSGTIFAFARTNDAGSTTTITAGGFLVNTTHVVAGVFTPAGNALSLYVDGARVATGARSGACTFGNALLIGNQWWSGALAYAWRGSIFDVRIWDRALPAQAIAHLYADPWAMYRRASTPVRGAAAAATRPLWLPSILHRRSA